MKEISVIIPVYNVEDSLQEALCSLLNQSVSDFEVFLVDDGSTDRSGMICDSVALSDKRISVIHQDNHGAHSARNRALSICKGKYVYFMDADDLLEEGALKTLLDCANDTESDIAVGAYQIEYGVKSKKKKTETKKVSCFDMNIRLPSKIPPDLTTELIFPPWNKLYRRELLLHNNIHFPATYWDDTIFNLTAFRYAKRIVFTSKSCYRYMKKRTDTETTKFRPDQFLKRLEEFALLEDLVLYKWGDSSRSGRRLIADCHIRNVWGCLVALFHTQSQIRGVDRWAAVKRIASHTSVRRYVFNVSKNAHLNRWMLILLKVGFTAPLYFTARELAVIRAWFPEIFNCLKR